MNPLPFFPAFDADQSSLLLEAHDAIDVRLGDEMADLIIAETALGALEAGHS
jgi:hypothetical protein